MKKIYLILASFTVVSSLAFAVQKNPQIRTCNLLGGEFVVASTHQDQIGFCQFDKALIGALDLTYFNNNESISQSINNYMKGQNNCDQVGQIETVIVIGGNSLQTCAFADGSYIELGTMIKGKESADNAKLNQVLGL